MSLTTTVDSMIERVRRDTMLGTYGPFYQLGAAVDAVQTTLAVAHEIEHITKGSILSVDFELMRVVGINHSTMTLDVVRGFLGSTAAAHDEMALIEQDPRAPKAKLLDDAQHEIHSWHDQLFRIVTLPIDVTGTSRVYDLAGVDAAGVTFLLEVRAAPSGTPVWAMTSSWTGDSWPRVKARLLRNMPVADLPSGFGLQVEQYPSSATTLRVAYASPFVMGTFAPATDLVATVGLEPQWLDILEFGLRARALSGSTFSRTDWRATGVNADAQAVSLLDVVRSVEMAQSQRNYRLAEEATKLRARYPYREG